eukprot:c36712_g1_i1 orf=212-496(-)
MKIYALHSLEQQNGVSQQEYKWPTSSGIIGLKPTYHLRFCIINHSLSVPTTLGQVGSCQTITPHEWHLPPSPCPCQCAADAETRALTATSLPTN